jgi:hypothetical protein
MQFGSAVCPIRRIIDYNKTKNIKKRVGVRNLAQVFNVGKSEIGIAAAKYSLRQ